MQSANVMVSKLGGLTTFEALACRLPIIADATTPPMPQEAGTVKLLSQKGAGILLKKPADIVGVVNDLVTDNPRYLRMKEATAGVSLPNSTESIAREILTLLPTQQNSASA